MANELILNLNANKINMKQMAQKGYTTANDFADYLVKKKKMDDILKTSVACGSYYANGNSLTKKSDYLKVKNLSKKVKIQKV